MSLFVTKYTMPTSIINIVVIIIFNENNEYIIFEFSDFIHV
ncbi:hypothetical protein CBGD1_2113 [Sulfurimonas gotlandica GD1]|nr:hypothetical protein CBGD1_2113 [Sulfurimonas gotlandica GD1]